MDSAKGRSLPFYNVTISIQGFVVYHGKTYVNKAAVASKCFYPKETHSTFNHILTEVWKLLFQTSFKEMCGKRGNWKFYGPEWGLPWWLFRVTVRRMCNLLSLDEVVCKCQFDPVDWRCCLVQPSLLIFCLPGLSVTDGGVLKSPNVRMDSSVFPCNSVSICLTFFVVVLLRVYILRIGTTSWKSGPFIIS